MVHIWLSWLNSMEAVIPDLSAAQAQETSGLRPSSGRRVAYRKSQTALYLRQPGPSQAQDRTQAVPGMLLENCQREARLEVGS